MAGIINIPTAAVVAGPEPEIAPKNMQAKIAAAEMPPVTGPAKLSASVTSRFDMPDASIKAPARINAGKAINGKEPTELKAICTSLIGLSPKNKNDASAATPSEAITGAPSTNSSKKEPNRVKTIEDSFMILSPRWFQGQFLHWLSSARSLLELLGQQCLAL